MILPEEIENQQFEVSFRGYNTREVDEFLSRVHADLEEMIREHEQFKRKIAAAELIAKDAKDHEEEFVASMEKDRSLANSILENAKIEGEKIIREAKNAASGIMSEVKRRAGDISSESRRTSAEMTDSAAREADEMRSSAEKEATELREKAVAEAEAIRAEADKYANEIRSAAESKAASVIADANAAAEKKLFSARTEADNIWAAADTESAAILDNARKTAAEITENAAKNASVYENYINEIRSHAEKLCFEIDAELKNSASRITLLSKRISQTEVPEKPEDTGVVFDIPEIPDIPDIPAHGASDPAPAHAVDKGEPVQSEELSEDVSKEVSVDEIILPETKDYSEGYFTEEYKLAMTELFGDDANTEIPRVSVTEDDDTYDYLENSILNETNKDDEDDDEDYGFDYDEDDDDDGTEDSGDTVTAEYQGLSSATKGVNISDMIDSDVINTIYKAPSQEEINVIFNE